MISKILISSLAAGGAFYVYMGMYKSPNIDTKKMGQKLFVYKDVMADYWNFKPELTKLKNDFSTVPSEEVTLGAVYYDNPRSVADKKSSRAVVGGFFDPSQKAMVESFLSKHPEYKMVETPEVESVSTQLPYRNHMSFRLSRLRKVRSQCYTYGFKNHKFDGKELVGLMELYPYLNGKDSSFEVMVPYGPNAKQFKLTSFNAPTLKRKNPYPGVIGDWNYIWFK